MPSLLFLTLADPARTPHADMACWALERAGWRVTCISPGGAKSVTRAMLGGNWGVMTFGKSSGDIFESSIWAALVKARFGDFDVVCIHSLGLSYRAGILFSLLGRGKPLVYFNPDFCDPVTYPWRSRLEGLLARRCSLHVNHEYHRAYILRTLHRSRTPFVVFPPNLPKLWPVPKPDPSIRKRLAGAAGEAAFILRLHGSVSDLRMTTQLMEAVASLSSEVRLVMTAPCRRGRLPTIGYELERRPACSPTRDVVPRNVNVFGECRCGNIAI